MRGIVRRGTLSMQRGKSAEQNEDGNCKSVTALFYCNVHWATTFTV